MNFSAAAGGIGTDCLNGIRRYWSGILLATVIAFASTFISDTRGGPTMLYALLLGMELHAISVEGKA